MITRQWQFGQGLGHLAQLDPQVQQRPQEHVAAEAANEVQIKGFHAPREWRRRLPFPARGPPGVGADGVGSFAEVALVRALIWLAA